MEATAFDSFGRGPDRLFERYMTEHCREWIFNTRPLTSIKNPFTTMFSHVTTKSRQSVLWTLLRVFLYSSQ